MVHVQKAEVVSKLEGFTQQTGQPVEEVRGAIPPDPHGNIFGNAVTVSQEHNDNLYAQVLHYVHSMQASYQQQPGALWQGMKQSSPISYEYASAVLAIPASLSEMEQVFSIVGYIDQLCCSTISQYADVHQVESQAGVSGLCSPQIAALHILYTQTEKRKKKLQLLSTICLAHVH